MNKILIPILCSIFWPLSLYLANTRENFLVYIFPSLPIIASLFLYERKYSYNKVLFLFSALIQPRLVFFPFINALLNFDLKLIKVNIIILLCSFLIIIGSFKQFYGQSIFVKDYDRRQMILRNITLYPNPIFARLFQNKAKVITDKFTSNFFALTDPNNYFFSFHPREDSINNQNLPKYPYFAIFPFLVGIFGLAKKNERFLVGTILSLVITLSFLTNFDRIDFVLWFPLLLVLKSGLEELSKNTIVFKFFSLGFYITTIAEILRIFVTYK